MDDRGLDLLFRDARTFRHWRDRAVDDATLRRLYDLLKLAPTSANCSPARIVFVRSPEAKERLRPCLADGNVEQTMQAPVTAIVAHDLDFHDRLPRLYRAANARAWFAGDPRGAELTAFRNGTLQGGYLILAARALGLDCGPMSGFDNEKLDRAFFPGERIKSNFLCNLGHGERVGLPERDERLGFEEACRVL